MNKEFRKLLEGATGKQQHVIAIVLDIRGFTPFCEKVDSFEVATYITKAYMKIIDNYFSDASFLKPTGDGLLIIIPYDDKTLKERINKTIESCLRLLHDFKNLCSEDPMIYFDTPTELGIGIARGSACCITCGEKILDYSGKVLNLASRLMDMSRPSGIVLESKIGLKLLSNEIQEAFLQDYVYVRGIAEEEPRMIYYTKEYTLIPDSYKKPIKEPRWEMEESRVLFKTLKSVPSTHLFINLKHKLLDEKKIIGKISYPWEVGGVTGLRRHFFDIGKEILSYRQRGKDCSALLAVKPLVKFLESKGIREDTELTINVIYPTL